MTDAFRNSPRYIHNEPWRNPAEQTGGLTEGREEAGYCSQPHPAQEQARGGRPSVSPFINDPDFTLYVGDVREVLASLPDESVHCVVTSPPYWGLRDYGTGLWDGGDPDCDHQRDVRKYADGCIGCGIPMQESTPGCRHCADRHWRRRKDGTPADRNYETTPEDHWERERARDQVTKVAQTFTDVCGKCGAGRVDRQLGLEATPDLYVENMVAVFREVRRVLRRDGACWLNLGDSYASGEVGRVDSSQYTSSGGVGNRKVPVLDTHKYAQQKPRSERRIKQRTGLKPKDLVGVPWRVAFALQADGWYLRADVIWSKPNPMPESVADRPTKAHEYLFLLTRSPRYFYDADAIREPLETWVSVNGQMVNTKGGQGNRRYGADVNRPGGSVLTGNMADGKRITVNPSGRNRRSVWKIPEDSALAEDGGQEALRVPQGAGERQSPPSSASAAVPENYQFDGMPRSDVWEIATEPYPEAHFATFPQALVEPCVKAGTSERGCCPVCGAPWERETEVSYRALGDPERQKRERLADQRVNHRNYDAEIHGGPQAMAYGRAEKHTTTTGWRPTCECQRTDSHSGIVGVDHYPLRPIPCTVLDPFMGSGTTALVARRLGRRSVGVELNETYAQLAARRLAQLSLLA